MPEVDEPEISLFAAIRVDRNRPVSDLDRFIALALPSFRARLPADLIREIVVAVPSGDVPMTTARLEGVAHVPLRVVDERELGAALDGMSGWMKQQMLKLAAPAVIRTPWFITLDADVVAARAVDRDFLLPGGRAIWEQEEAAAHLEWWDASARLLGIPRTIAGDEPAFGVTPAIMHTESLRELGRAIEAAHPGRGWLDTLVEHHDAGWTEYTLYWTYLVASGRAHELYAAVDRLPYALGGSVWTPESLSGLDLDAAFAADAAHAFFVFQSNLELPLEDTVRLLRPHIEPAAETTAMERQAWARHRRAFGRRRARRRAISAVRKALGRD